MKTVYIPITRTRIIGRSTPGLTYALFQSIAQKAARLAARKQRRARIVRKLKLILTFGRAA